MEFGRLPEKDLKKVDFSLPPDPAINKQVLKKTNKSAEVWLGCAKWGRREWVGKIYPKGGRESNFLEHYLHHYNSIELNATHYKIYSASEIEKWNEKAAGLNFRFCPKVPQSISHFGNLGSSQSAALTDAFFEGILAFGEHLGPIFLQVGERYSPKQRDDLYAYLTMLPTDLQFFLEVRHPEWFSDKVVRDELFDTLRRLGIGAVITDTAGRRDCAHMALTIPKTFIRFVGNSLHKTDYVRCEEWCQRIKFWLDKGLKELYFFMHMHDEAFSPELSLYLVDLLNKTCNLNLPRPVFVASSLFNQFSRAAKKNPRGA